MDNPKKEDNKTTLFIITSKRMKYLGVNKNYRTLLGEIKDSLDKWKGISHLWIGRLPIVLRWQYSPNRTPSKFKLFFPPRFQQTDPRIVRIERVLG